MCRVARETDPQTEGCRKGPFRSLAHSEDNLGGASSQELSMSEEKNLYTAKLNGGKPNSWAWDTHISLQEQEALTGACCFFPLNPMLDILV